MRLPACEACPPRKSLRKLDPKLVRLLEELFSVLASGTRLRLLHALTRRPQTTVSSLARSLGMKIAAVSNQLRSMADKGILGRRKKGVKVLYFVSDPCVAEIFDKGACLALDSLKRSESKR